METAVVANALLNQSVESSESLYRRKNDLTAPKEYFNYGYDLNSLAKRLRNNEFEAIVFPSGKEATNYLLRRCKNHSVGVGDSHSLWQIGFIDKLKQTVGEHYLGDEKDRKKRQKSMIQDVFLLSVNAIAYDTGELVNIDSKGNRISGSLYYPEEKIFVFGKNKIAKDLPSALERARIIAAFENYRRKGIDVPCIKAGKCMQCSHPDCICRITCIIHKKPKNSITTIVLIDEELGF
jgi:hypothetical protein